MARERNGKEVRVKERRGKNVDEGREREQGSQYEAPLLSLFPHHSLLTAELSWRRKGAPAFEREREQMRLLSRIKS